jgi:hypothetical protein
MSNIERFEDNPLVARYDMSPHPAGGTHLRVFYENGYGNSVIRHQYSYGGSQGLFEVAVLNGEGHLVYDTPVADDVVGWCTPAMVDDLLKKTSELPPREREIGEGQEVRHGSLEHARKEVGSGGEEAVEEAG